jgi:uncharacterized protein YutE (UPF0331/DUF86 family)
MHASADTPSLTTCKVILCDIRRLMDDAEHIFRRKNRFDQDRRDFYAQTMVLFALVNRLVDLAREVSLIRGYIRPDEQVKNKVFFKRLHDHGVISWEMRQQMIDLVTFRNVVSHHFSEITREELEKVWMMAPICQEFITIMEYELARNEYEKKRTILLVSAAALTLALVFLWYFS